jgi:hypothetical protein
MEREYKSGRMDQFMKAFGLKTWPQEKAGCIMRMEISMKGYLKLHNSLLKDW